MTIHRRLLFKSFIMVGSYAAAFLAIPNYLRGAQRGTPPPPLPPPSGQRPDDAKEDSLEHKPDPHVLLKENQKNIKRDVERLADLAQELKQEVGKTDSADVLSLALVRKAEEIERLAKAIKNRARG